jgi:hypothetical protein
VMIIGKSEMSRRRNCSLMSDIGVSIHDGNAGGSCWFFRLSKLPKP